MQKTTPSGSSRMDDHPVVRAADHDIRTPFNVLFGPSELARDYGDDLTPAQLRGHIASMRDASGLAFRIATRLADFARALSGLWPDAAFAVDAMLASLVSTNQPRAQLNGLAFDAPAATDAYARGDERFIGLAVEALVENALRYTPPGGRIAMRATAADGVVRIVVADDGPGLGATDPFAPGAKNSAPGLDETPGAGLSLAVARYIATACGGDLTHEAGLDGAGVAFVLTLQQAR